MSRRSSADAKNGTRLEQTLDRESIEKFSKKNVTYTTKQDRLFNDSTATTQKCDKEQNGTNNNENHRNCYHILCCEEKFIFSRLNFKLAQIYLPMIISWSRNTTSTKNPHTNMARPSIFKIDRNVKLVVMLNWKKNLRQTTS